MLFPDFTLDKESKSALHLTLFLLENQNDEPVYNLQIYLKDEKRNIFF